MPDHSEEMMPHQRPTAAMPLLGLTVLIVEDSRFASDILRLMCLRSGARIRRADSLKQARRFLATSRPHFAIVDLGLPDGSGLTLIEEIVLSGYPIMVIATSGDDGAEASALHAGAAGFLPKPATQLFEFQKLLVDLAPEGAPIPDPEPNLPGPISPDRLALYDDLAHIADILTEPGAIEDDILHYVAQFLRGLTQIAPDDELAEAAEQLGQCVKDGQPPRAAIATIVGLLHDRLAREPGF